MAELTFREAVGPRLGQEMERDEARRAAGRGRRGPRRGVQDHGRVARGPLRAGRVWDTPISEQAIVGGAMGAAMGGMRPVAEIMFSDFSGTCWDLVANEIAKTRYMTGGQVTLPLVVRRVQRRRLGFGAQHRQSAGRAGPWRARA